MTKPCKFYLRLLHPKEIAGKAAELFFFWRLHSSLIFEIPISGGSAKRQRHLFFDAYCMVFSSFEKNIFCSALRKISGRSIFRKLFILFTEILLKSRVCLKTPPLPKPKPS
jgi:hypothetical protein